MRSAEFVDLLGRLRATAILRTSLPDAVVPAMEAAIRGGFRCVEFTLTTPGALDAIREFSGRDGIVAGAGTVLTPADARAAIDAGASFLVSPVVDETVVEVALAADVAVLPGCHTPTEMLRAHRAGAPLLKLFPAPGAGPDYVRQILGPLPFLKIVPTSGVEGGNAKAFLDAGSFAVGFVTPLFDAADLAASRFDRIEARARDLLAAVYTA